MSARTARVSPLLASAQPPSAYAQTPDAGSAHGVWHVRDGIYMIVGAGGNTTVQVGDDGVLVVDTKLASRVGRRCSTRSAKSPTSRFAT